MIANTANQPSSALMVAASSMLRGTSMISSSTCMAKPNRIISPWVRRKPKKIGARTAIDSFMPRRFSQTSSVSSPMPASVLVSSTLAGRRL